MLAPLLATAIAIAAAAFLPAGVGALLILGRLALAANGIALRGCDVKQRFDRGESHDGDCRVF